ncbi:MAG: hypothetical protein V1668_04190 [Patescibacteria group bacterium]
MGEQQIQQPFQPQQEQPPQEKPKKRFNKKWWIWILWFVLVILMIITFFSGLLTLTYHQVIKTPVKTDLMKKIANDYLEEGGFTDGCLSAEVETWITSLGRVYTLEYLEGGGNTSDVCQQTTAFPHKFGALGTGLFDNDGNFYFKCIINEGYPKGIFRDDICDDIINKDITERPSGQTQIINL